MSGSVFAREIRAANGGYNRNYWHAVVATMNGGPIDPLFRKTLYSRVRDDDAFVAAAYFRLGATVGEISDLMSRGPRVVAAKLGEARAAMLGERP